MIFTNKIKNNGNIWSKISSLVMRISSLIALEQGPIPQSISAKLGHDICETSTMRLHRDNLIASIFYVCNKASDNPARLDDVKLNKVLWYADAAAYISRGNSITKDTYIRKPRGPVAQHNRAALHQLENLGVIRRGRVAGRTGGFETRYDVISSYEDLIHSLSDDGLDPLSTEDKRIFDDVFEYVVNRETSDNISERTHGAVWELAEEDEPLPLYTIFAECTGTVKESHIKDALEEA